MWMPRDLQAANQQNAALATVARLKPGVTLEQAQADLRSIEAGLVQDQSNQPARQINLMPLHERLYGDLRPSLYLFSGAVGFLLLLACANVANLLLARVLSRQQEIAIRAALGATKGRLARQVLTESLLLAIPGGIIGTLFSVWGVRLLVALGPHSLSRLQDIGIDARVLAFTLLISTLTGLLFGMFPILQVPKYSLIEIINKGRQSDNPGSRRVRNLLVISEIAVALILLIGAGLMANSFNRLQNVNLGFNADNLLAGMVTLTPRKYRSEAQVNDFYQEMIRRLEASPGIAGAAAISEPPVPEGKNVVKIDIEGQPEPATGATPDADFHIITGGYFQVANILLLEGRSFNEFDTPKAMPVVVINKMMAERYWHDTSPLGKRIRLAEGSDSPWLTVVGIAGDTRNDRLNLPPYPEIYVPNTQMPFRAMFFLVRVADNPTKQLATVKSVIHGMDNEIALYNLNSIEGMLADEIAAPRFNTLIMLIFAGVAVTLAAVGIYGVLSYTNTRRTHEIGVRMALGATRGRILQLLIRQSMSIALLGIAIGLGGAYALMRLMSSFLFGIAATDFLTFTAAAVLVLFISFLASFFPCHRATKVDPGISLRHE
jgi:putative ABC transport system permease protein